MSSGTKLTSRKKVYKVLDDSDGIINVFTIQNWGFGFVEGWTGSVSFIRRVLHLDLVVELMLEIRLDVLACPYAWVHSCSLGLELMLEIRLDVLACPYAWVHSCSLGLELMLEIRLDVLTCLYAWVLSCGLGLELMLEIRLDVLTCPYTWVFEFSWSLYLDGLIL